MSLYNFSSLPLELPDGSMLIAVRQDDAEYPRLAIYLHRLNESDEPLCFAEYNPNRPKGQELCIGAYSEADDEPSHYESYQKAEET